MPQPELKFTDEQKQLYKAALAPQATAEQWAYFITECERRALVPGVHVVFQTRTSKEFNKALQRDITVEKVTLITTINALRLIAERSNRFEGYGRFAYFYNDDEGKPTIKSDIPLGRIPHAVGVELYRNGWRNPVFSVARYEACVQLKSDKNPTAMWYKRGEEQLAKCAEANGLRMIAPEECGGLYIEEEWASQHETDAPVETVTAPAVIPTPTVAPPINQTAAPIATEPVAVPHGAGAGAHSGNGSPSTVAPVAVAPPKPPAPPVRPAPPKLAAPPVPKPTPAPISAPPVTAPVTEDPRHRQPAVEQPAHESPAELAEVADRIARDKDPVIANVHGLNITDEDLPENLRPGYVAPNPTPAPPVSNVPSADSSKPQTTVAPSAVPAPTASANATAPSTGETPANPAEYSAFMNRAAKIVRDKLEKQAGVKNAGALVKDFLLKQAGKTRLQQITAATFETLITKLETATPQDAAALVK